MWALVFWMKERRTSIVNANVIKKKFRAEGVCTQIAWREDKDLPAKNLFAKIIKLSGKYIQVF